MQFKKVVILSSKEAYSLKHEKMLRGLLNEEIDLIAIVGVDCESWEEAIDWLCVELDLAGELPGAFCNTTSHPREKLDSVLAFAKQWCVLKGWPENITILDV